MLYFSKPGGALLHGDCLEEMKRLPDNSVDMILCDLPYGEVNRRSSGLRLLDKGVADIFDNSLLPLYISSYHRLLKSTGCAYIFCGTEQISPLISLAREYKYSTRLGCWNKTNPSPMNGTRMWLSGLEFCVFIRGANATFNEHCKKALWDAPCGTNKLHPTQKPLVLFERLIKASTDEGALVLDNCAGSGTTAVACENLNRRWCCIEKEQKYCDVIVSRVRKDLSIVGGSL